MYSMLFVFLFCDCFLCSFLVFVLFLFLFCFFCFVFFLVILQISGYRTKIYLGFPSLVISYTFPHQILKEVIKGLPYFNILYFLFRFLKKCKYWHSTETSMHIYMWYSMLIDWSTYHYIYPSLLHNIYHRFGLLPCFKHTSHRYIAPNPSTSVGGGG